MDDNSELQWRYLKDNLDHSRHHETLRATTTNALLVLAGAGLSIVGYDKCVQQSDVPVLSFVAIIGVFGAVFVAKQTERADAHYERARDLRDAIDQGPHKPEFERLRKQSDARHRGRYAGLSRWIRWPGLRQYWIGLHLLVAALSIVLITFADSVQSCTPETGVSVSSKARPDGQPSGLALKPAAAPSGASNDSPPISPRLDLQVPPDAPRDAAVTDQADLKSLELLFDYTKFHIGAYLTIAASFITLASLKKGETFALPLRLPLVYVAIGLFMMAGLAGGVIVSTVTQCYGVSPQRTPPAAAPAVAPGSSAAHAAAGTASPSSPPTRCSSTRQFMSLPMGPGNGELISFKGAQWIYIEHLAFWLGLLFALASFVFAARPRTAIPSSAT